ncbi:ribonuclease E inhibitor RraB [Streptomyces sp. NPDC058295]|uniref:ribonuclease E inhibitor RraB n=1 Tax=Streptomyces sp. NPDC058295 TaxID=3346431 RepID=UPI0036EC98B5
MTNGVVPYTHWAYFSDEESARRCAEDLSDYVIRIRPPWEEVPDWLLLAGRDVGPEDDALIRRHHEVQAIVEKHGGLYDYGEFTLDLSTGKAVADPILTGEWKMGGDR